MSASHSGILDILEDMQPLKITEACVGVEFLTSRKL